MNFTTHPADLLANLYDPLVRDLAWSLFSAPLMQKAPEDSDWPVYTDSIQRLQRLDRDPTPLHNAVMEKRAGRLGLYFEALWQFWLRDNPDYMLHAHNLQINTNGITCGELDIIVQDLHSGQFQHWELAVKFYLGIGDTTATSAWIGPNAQDRLDRKLKHLHSHQLPLLQHPETQSHLATSGWDIQQQRLILKGRLYYPLRKNAPAPLGSAPDHQRGWWARREEFLASFGSTEIQWMLLDRQHWLAPLRREAASQLQATTELMRSISAMQHPLCIAGFIAEDECSRGFIVPPSWPDKI